MKLHKRLNNNERDSFYQFLRLLLFLLPLIVRCARAEEEEIATMDHHGSPQQRIVGGSETDNYKYPFIVSVRQKLCKTCAFEHHCSGTIYAANAILTSANCVRTAESGSTHVVAGTKYLTNAIQDGLVFPVDRIIVHQNATIDIAVLFLSLDIPVHTNRATKVATLATEEPSPGQWAFVAGWGLTEEAGDYSEVLNEVELKIVERSVCDEAYQWNDITENEICAGIEEGGRDGCKGDAGSPLLVNGKVAGLVSYGYGCGRPQQPGVYLNIVHLREWIAHYIDGVHYAFL